MLDRSLRPLLRYAVAALGERLVPPCPGCGEDTRRAPGLCQQCRLAAGIGEKWIDLDFFAGHRTLHLRALGRYWSTDGLALSPAAVALRRFKYAGDRAAGHALAQTLSAAPRLPQSRHSVRLVPIPLHGRRLRVRGFNQSAWLARPLARANHLRLRTDVLRRSDDHHAQARRTGAARRELSPLTFAAVSRRANGRAILVDDVYTTGWTLRRAAEALLRVGIEVDGAIVLLVADRTRKNDTPHTPTRATM